MKLSDAEKVLYEELVVWLAIRVTRGAYSLPPELCRPCEDGIHTKGAGIQHDFMSAFEAACDVLLRLDIAYPLDKTFQPMADPSGGYAYGQIAWDVPEIRERLRGELPANAPKLPQVLLAFLQVATEFDGLLTPRGPFVPPRGFEAAFKPLLRCGYAEPVGQGVRWTDRVAPQMRALYAWSNEGEAKEDLDQVELDKMWRTLPIKVREVFFSGGPVNVMLLAMVIDTFWVEDEWRYIDHLARAKKAGFRHPDSLARARGLVERREVCGA
jgi:hypothetical protein